MSDELVFYTHPMSRGRIARWMLEEVGAPYRTELLHFATTMKAPEYLALNPMGKVPAITHRGVTVTETAAICAYLADAFPEAGLAPPVGDPLRGPYYRWLFFTSGPGEASVTAKSLDLLAPPEKKGMVGYGSYEDVMDGFEHALRNGPYVLGEQFSAADVYLASQLGWGLMFKTIEARPVFAEYGGRTTARPAAQRPRQLDDAAMPAPAPG